MAGCDHVVHLAAVAGGIAGFHGRPHTLTEANNALSNSVVRAALDHEVARFVYVSSSMVFERAEQHPTPESHLPDCPVPRSAYGFSKLTGEVYCRAAHDEHGLPYTIVRPSNAYGPGEEPGPTPGIGHLVPDLIRKTLELAEGASLPIFGDGTQTRTLIYVDDIADGIVTAMASEAGRNEDFNISTAQELTVADIARAVWAACGRDPEAFALEHLPAYPSDVRRGWPDVGKARDVLGWEAQTPFGDGVVRTVDWVRACTSVSAS
jgi:nucleoside-diphosphate-sugar epimerase